MTVARPRSCSVTRPVARPVSTVGEAGIEPAMLSRRGYSPPGPPGRSLPCGTPRWVSRSACVAADHGGWTIHEAQPPPRSLPRSPPVRRALAALPARPLTWCLTLPFSAATVRTVAGSSGRVLRFRVGVTRLLLAAQRGRIGLPLFMGTVRQRTVQRVESRNRTGVSGVAARRLATRPSRQCTGTALPRVVPVTGPATRERVTGFEPASSGWKPEVLGHWTTRAWCVLPPRGGAALPEVPRERSPGATRDRSLGQGRWMKPAHHQTHCLVLISWGSVRWDITVRFSCQTLSGTRSPGEKPDHPLVEQAPERLVGIEPTTFSLATRRATTAPQSHVSRSQVTGPGTHGSLNRTGTASFARTAESGLHGPAHPRCFTVCPDGRNMPISSPVP